MSDQLDFEHVAVLLEEHLGRPVPEVVLADLEALVAHTLRIGGDKAIEAAKRVVEAAYDGGTTKSELLRLLDGLRSEQD